MILPILTYPDPKLNKKSEKVELINKDIKELITNMLLTMYACGGCGLAAPQVGVFKRVIVLSKNSKRPSYLINPKIIMKSKKVRKSYEQCLSVPDKHYIVNRSCSIVIESMTMEGDTFRYIADHASSVVIQHEIDHLDGILINSKSAG